MAIAAAHSISIRAVETDEELRLANGLMAEVHSDGPIYSAEGMTAHGDSYPGFQKDHTRVAFFENQLAGALRLNTETLRIGEARLKTGGITMVSTSPYFRRRGVCTALIEDTLRYMNRQRYDVSMAFGPAEICRHLNFEPLLPDYAIQVDTSTALRVGRMVSDQHRMRDAKPGDIPTIQKIHQLDDARVSCSLLRSKAHITNKWRRYDGLKVCISASGKVVGYVWLRQRDNVTTILEMGAREAVFFPDLVAYAARTAHARMSPTLLFHLPPDHPVTVYLGRIPSAMSVAPDRSSQGHMRFIHIAETLEHMIPEWEFRVAGTLLQELRCEITMIVDRVPYRIRSNRGSIDVSPEAGRNKFSTTHSEFLGLVTGDHAAHSCYSRLPRLINRQGKALLYALFPKRYPYVYMFDRF